LQLLGGLQIFHERIGDFENALHYAKRSAVVCETIEDPAARAVAHSLLGVSLHLVGDHANARSELEAALEHGPIAQRTGTIHLGFDHHNRAAIALARTLWLQGHPAQAVDRARQTVAHATSLNHPVTLSIALIWAISVLFWTGDLESAETLIDRFVAHADSHSLAPYQAAGRGFKGELAIRRGETKGGIECVRACLEALHAARYELLTTVFNISLVQALAAMGRFAEAITLVDETIGLVEANGDLVYMPELLRVKGCLLLAKPHPSADEAEMCFRQSLDMSRRQGAPAWELRAAVDLAKLMAAQGRQENARALLRPVFEAFVEGSDTADLKAAEQLLMDLG
jgi:predicted ATPase